MHACTPVCMRDTEAFSGSAQPSKPHVRYAHGKEHLSISSQPSNHVFRCYLSKRACADGVNCNTFKKEADKYLVKATVEYQKEKEKAKWVRKEREKIRETARPAPLQGRE